MKLESRSNIKLFLAVTITDYDDLIDLINSQVSANIEKYLNRKLKKQEYTEYFNIKIDKKYFNLKAYPIDLTEDFTVTQYDVEDTINSDYYVWEDLGVVEYFTPRNHSNQPKPIKIVYTGGYEEVYSDSEYVLDVPDDLARACLLQVVFEFRSRRDLGLLSVTTPDGSISKSRSAELLPNVKKILDSYRNYPTLRL